MCGVVVWCFLHHIPLATFEPPAVTGKWKPHSSLSTPDLSPLCQWLLPCRFLSQPSSPPSFALDSGANVGGAVPLSGQCLSISCMLALEQEEGRVREVMSTTRSKILRYVGRTYRWLLPILWLSISCNLYGVERQEFARVPCSGPETGQPATSPALGAKFGHGLRIAVLSCEIILREGLG